MQASPSWCMSADGTCSSPEIPVYCCALPARGIMASVRMAMLKKKCLFIVTYSLCVIIKSGSMVWLPQSSRSRLNHPSRIFSSGSVLYMRFVHS